MELFKGAALLAVLGTLFIVIFVNQFQKEKDHFPSFCGLAVFNLFPIPPLDGSKVLFAVLPEALYWKLMRYERYGMLLMVALLMTGVVDIPLNFLRDGLIGLLAPISQWTMELLTAIHR